MKKGKYTGQICRGKNSHDLKREAQERAVDREIETHGLAKFLRDVAGVPTVDKHMRGRKVY